VGAELRRGRLCSSVSPEWTGFTAAVPASSGTRERKHHRAGGQRPPNLGTAGVAGPGLEGVVIALNDVTDVSRAERVLAWGDGAAGGPRDQNPLTPMRLGLQHLRRVYRDRRPDFDHTLEDTADRMPAKSTDRYVARRSPVTRQLTNVSRSTGSIWRLPR
jgi:nitrogen fixation/metabolism regulation signal transduction histidine kinase